MSYKPPFILFNGHLETIYPALMRKVELLPYARERIETSDRDFLDLDWLRQGNSRLVILSHGLEGDSHRPYIRGMAKAFLSQGFDVLAWNFRGCSTDMNLQLRFYHSGATEDLHQVIQHALALKYTNINLVGFSLGGNLTLKYLGEQTPPAAIRRAAVFSVPMDLHTSCQQISLPANRVYAKRFLKSLKSKIIRKAAIRQELDIRRLSGVASIMDFDEYYTAPLHGFGGALEYYEKNSSIHFLQGITIPTLIVNALNDPFLSPACYPEKILAAHPFITFECPARGGHVGFAQFNKNGLYWSEERALQFILR